MKTEKEISAIVSDVFDAIEERIKNIDDIYAAARKADPALDADERARETYH